MPRLLSDVDGKIKHVLTASLGRLDEHRTRGLLGALPPDVEVTILYSHISESEFPENLIATGTSSFHRKSLERIVAEISPGRVVNLIGLQRRPHMFMQDLFHVFEGRQIMSSLPDGVAQRILSGQLGLASPAPLHADITNILYDVANTAAELLSTPFWQNKGFSVLPNMGALIEGGEVIVFDDTVHVGERYAQSEFRSFLQTQGISERQIRRKARTLATLYNAFKRDILESVSYLDGTRTPGFVLNEVEDHIDMFFTPLPGNVVVIGDVYTAMKHLKPPSNIRVAPFYQRLGSALERFANSMAKKHKVVRIPALPSMYDSAKPVKFEPRVAGEWIIGQTMRVSWNNVLQESVKAESGQVSHIVYVPQYSLPADVPVPAHMKGVISDSLTHLDPDKFSELQQMAFKAFKDQGVTPVPVPFCSFYGKDGGLRCSVKVLERT